MYHVADSERERVCVCVRALPFQNNERMSSTSR